ncbi:MAG TPA: alpha/beta hydrolase, partial [Bacteroidales bacterium]|nr:alpha/beta hydrolase [Bacteroidales bacterium]
MKRCVFIMLWATMSISLYAQDITGTWNGALVMGKAQLRIVFHIEKTDTGYIATMDSPDQGAKGIEVTSVEYQHSDTFKLI